METRDRIPYLIIGLGIIIGISFVVISLMQGCATRGYVETLTSWNDLMESYEAQYQIASPETQAKWKSEIDPKILKANDALNIWEDAVGAADEQEKKAAYIALEREVVRLFLKYGIRVEN